MFGFWFFFWLKSSFVLYFLVLLLPHCFSIFYFIFYFICLSLYMHFFYSFARFEFPPGSIYVYISIHFYPYTSLSESLLATFGE